MARDKESHRDKLLEAALELMLRKGFVATRVDEICEAAGVTKGSFYHYFESKDALAGALIDRFYIGLTEALGGGGWTEEKSPLERARGFLRHAAKAFAGPQLRRGCLLGSFALDLSETHPSIRAEIERRFNELTAMLRGVFLDALEEAGRSSRKTADLLATQFLSVLQGSIVLAKAHADHNKIVEGIGTFGRLFEAMLAQA